MIKQINLVGLSSLNNDTFIDAFGMANFVILSFPLAYALGTSLALSTKVSSDCKTRRYGQCGQHLNQLLVVYAAGIVPICVLIWFCGPLLKLCGQGPARSERAQRLVRLQLPAVVAQCALVGYSSFLIAMQKSFIPLMVALPFVAVHAIQCYVYFGILKLGADSCALANNVTFVGMFIALQIYLKAKARSHPESAISRALDRKLFDCDGLKRGFGGFVKLAGHSLVLFFFENVSVEAIALMSGELDKHQQAAMVVVYTFSFLVLYWPQSLADATTVLIAPRFTEMTSGYDRITIAQE